MKSPPTLNIVGAGRLGKTLGRLFHQDQCFTIKSICNQSIISAQGAVDFIGAGVACASLHQLPPADVIMISVPDDKIEAISLELKDVTSASMVFHCSGAAASTLLSPLKNSTSSIASMHPFMTFATTKESADYFKGTYCAFEGDDAAYPVLESAFNQIGGHVFRITTEKKALYHAATALSCNYLVALMDMAAQVFQEAGISRTKALAMIQPIAHQTITNIFNLDTSAALTGPIARGNVQTVQLHLDALSDPDIKNIYKSLGFRLVELARRKGEADKNQLSVIEELLVTIR